VIGFAGATNGATCPTDSSRSQPIPISQNRLETKPHVAQPNHCVGLRNRRSQVRILSGAFRCAHSVNYRLNLGDRGAAAALAAGLDLLATVGAPPGRAHPEELVGLAGQLADHGTIFLMRSDADPWRYPRYTHDMAKVLVSFDDRLVKRIDRRATAAGKTRSGYLAELAQQDLAKSAGPGESPVARAAMRKLDRLFAKAPTGDSTTAVREERDAR
jgi:hypothetical protein